ncbi:MAG: hypothetical protein STSR0009_28460 [Methanoregula sp.]
MSNFYGISPQSVTRQVVEKFENNVMIRKDHRFQVATGYPDMERTGAVLLDTGC